MQRDRTRELPRGRPEVYTPRHRDTESGFPVLLNTREISVNVSASILSAGAIRFSVPLCLGVSNRNAPDSGSGENASPSPFFDK
jgi:hypothetical protein